MKNIRLRQLALVNFKGLTFTLNANCNDVDVFGDNATGKTTIDDAYHWLFTDRDAKFGTAMEIKNLDQDGKAAHNLDHEVYGMFEVDGQEIMFRKVYHEVWTKQRGGTAKEFTGHTTDYYVDMSPVPKKEYQSRVADIATEEEIKILTSPSYFAEKLPWADRRKVLLAIGGNVDDAAVIDSLVTMGDKSILDFPQIIGPRTIDAHRDMVKAREKELNVKLGVGNKPGEIQIRIDESTKGLPDIKGIDVAYEAALAGEVGREVESLQQHVADLKSGGGLAEKRAALAEAEAALTKAKDDAYVAASMAIRAEENKLPEMENALRVIRNEIADLDRDLVRMSKEAAAGNAKIEEIRAAWRSKQAETWTVPTAEENCPHCGQDIPEDIRAAINNRAMANWQKAKKEALDAIVAPGAGIKSALAATMACIEDTDALLSNKKGVLAAKETALAELQGKIATMKSGRDAGGGPLVETAQANVDRINAEIADMEKGGPTEEIAKIDRDIAKGQEALAVIASRIESVNTHTKGMDRIKELETEQKTLAKEFERCERELNMIDRFERAKVAMLDGKINSHFSIVRWKLFDDQINGGIAPCCEPMVDGVPYSKGLNNAATIQAGLDIINTLSRHHGKSLPVFIDNAESVTTLPAVDAQVVRLIVSEPDKELRVVWGGQFPTASSVNNELEEAAR